LFKGRGAPLFIYLDLFSIKGEGMEVNVYFSPSFDMCKEEGKGVSFFQKTFFFILEWIGRGIRVFILSIR
jgi:hypothetical protein